MGHDHLVSESLNDETERSAGSLHPAGSASAWTSQIAGLEERVDKLRGDAYRAKRYDLSAPLQDVKRALYKIRVQEMKTPNAESSEPGAKTNDRPMARNSKPTTATGSARRSRRSSSSNVILFAGTAVAQSTLKEAIVRLMARCGPKDTWKRNEKPHLFDAIIELSNLLDGHFTTEEAIEVGDRIGVSLRPPNEKGQP